MADTKPGSGPTPVAPSAGKTAEPAKSVTDTAAVGSTSGSSNEASKDEEFEKALAEPNKVPTPTDAELDAADEAEYGATLSKINEDASAFNDVLERMAIAHLDVMNPTTPDSHVLYGIPSFKFTVGDARVLSRFYRLAMAKR